ncbi:hypothetical protein GTQ48_07960 [Alteromonas genovensis]|uniref:Uncharacterized protein n=1 Tax=Alteromonas genovensis TaxID=471225 RepID=A0A6N9TG32_9ALTE|nr:hypothetical protein [Alteromonas genovensis]NDW15452.1 hypothetical protein [Alteromonas genovensis]
MNRLSIPFLQTDTQRAILIANKQMEQAEVILSNLLALRHSDEDRFIIPHDDVVVSIEAAIKLLCQNS